MSSEELEITEFVSFSLSSSPDEDVMETEDIEEGSSAMLLLSSPSDPMLVGADGILLLTILTGDADAIDSHFAESSIFSWYRPSIEFIVFCCVIVVWRRLIFVVGVFGVGCVSCGCCVLSK
jgi:hypothetical protein